MNNNNPNSKPSIIVPFGDATRREVLRGATLAGIGAAAGAFSLGAPGTARAQTPRRGGAIRVATSTGSVNDTFDPARVGTSSDFVRAFLVFSGLTELDSKLDPQPALAESWSHDKGTLWTFKLRSGVRFHDGKPLTSADVVYSLSRHKVAAVASRAKALADQMEEIKATGPLEVQIKLVSPNLELPVLLGSWSFLIVQDGATDFAKPVGTGPFRVQDVTPGVRATFVRNDGFWRSGQPYLDRIDLIPLTDENARINSLLAGDIHLTMAINPRAAATLQSDPRVALLETKSGTYCNLIFRQNSPPLNNRDLVLGVKTLLNRPQMISQIYQRFAIMGNDQPIAPTYKYYADLPQRAYDPELAKFHLNRAGMLNSRIQLTTSEGIGRAIDIAVMLQQSAAEIGFGIDIQRVPAEGYYNNIWMKVPFHMAIITQRPTTDIMLSQYKSDSALNEAGWSNEKFDQLLLAARSELDEAKRRQMYADMQLLIKDEGGTAIPLFYSTLDAHTSKLKGMQPVPVGNMMGYNFGAHVWLEA